MRNFNKQEFFSKTASGTKIVPRACTQAIFILACLIVALHIAHGGAQVGRKAFTAWQQSVKVDDILSTDFKFGCLSARCQTCLANIENSPRLVTFAGNSSQYVGVDLKVLEKHTDRPLQQCYQGSSFIEQWSKTLNGEVENQPGQSIYYGFAMWEFVWNSIPMPDSKARRYFENIESEFSGLQWNYRDRLMSYEFPYHILNGFLDIDEEIPTLTDVLKRQSYYKFRRESSGLKSDLEVEETVRKFIESMGPVGSIVLFRAPDLDEVVYHEIPPSRILAIEKIVQRTANEYSNARLIPMGAADCRIVSSDFWHQRSLDLDVNHINKKGREKYTECLLKQLVGNGIFK
jgi:hypothetical protein